MLLVSFHNKNGLDFLDDTPTQQIIVVVKNVVNIRAEHAHGAAVTLCIKAGKDNVGEFALPVSTVLVLNSHLRPMNTLVVWKYKARRQSCIN